MNYPVLKPLPIKTKGYPWYSKIKIWLTSSRTWMVAEDYELYIPWLHETLKVPKGFVFDGASVPKLFWPILSPTGILFLPGLFHDFGYRYNCYLTSDNRIIYKNAGKTFFDTNFKKMGVWINDLAIIDTVAKLALGGFGFAAWKSNRKKEKESWGFLNEYLTNKNKN